jgi:ABC-type antimicrobial peptide transport system permease subunit
MKNSLKILSIAVKNNMKHPGKNILVGIMVFLAAFIFLFTASLVQESKNCWRDYFGTTTTGYCNVGVKAGMKKDMTAPDFDFPKKYVSLDVVKYLDENKISYSGRLHLAGIKYNFVSQKFDGGENPCNIIGTDFEHEMKSLTNLKMVEGRYNPDVENGAVVWKKMMQRYNWKTGDEISFFINDDQNNPMPYTFVITGVVENASGNNMEVEADIVVSPVVFVKYNYLARVLGVEEGAYTELSIWERDKSKLAGIQSVAGKVKNEFYYADEAYFVISGVTGFVNFLGTLIGTFILIVFIITTFNVNVLGFMDRQKEIGTMLAIGARPVWVIRLLLSEMISFSVIAFGVSVAVYGSLSVLLPNGVSFGEMGILFSDKNFHFYPVLPAIAGALVSVMLAMFVSTVYPLYLTYKMNPVEVFREGTI